MADNASIREPNGLTGRNELFLLFSERPLLAADIAKAIRTYGGERIATLGSSEIGKNSNSCFSLRPKM